MCIFDKIIAGEIPSNKVLENENFLAFHDINPKAPIHILIIPKAHFENFQCFPAAQMSAMAEFIQQVAVAVGVDKSGYRLLTNCGENSGQEVMHLHFHLMGGTNLKWTGEASDPRENF